MAIVNGYCTRTELINELDDNSGTTLSTTRLDLIAEQASRLVEAYTGRQFYPTVETRYFTPAYNDWLSVDDLLAVTTLKTDDGNREYATTWAATDYDLLPANSLDKDEPYSMIRRTPLSTQYFPTVRLGAQIVGRWGYYEVPAATGATLNGDITAAATSVVVSDGTLLSVGHVLKIDDEYLRVDVIATNTLTVIRGANGSTAATHSSGATLYALTFPGITMATLRLATRLWHLRKAPMGIAVAGVQGLTGGTAGTRWIQRDWDLQNMLAPYSGGKML